VRAVLVLAHLIASAPSAPLAPWIVLPINSENAPPTDPTLLRLSKTVGEAIQKVVATEVRVASRDVRDQQCPGEDGKCPEHVSEMLAAERVISLALSPDFRALKLRVYHKRGIEREGKIPCTFEEGIVECQLDQIEGLLKPKGPLRALDRAAVQKSWEKLWPRIARCLKGKQTSGEGKEAPAVSFRAHPDGRVADVRIIPDALSDDPAYACIARTVESLKVAPFDGNAEPFRFNLEEPKPAPASKKRGDLKTRAR
jgi:hypothetical protein